MKQCDLRESLREQIRTRLIYIKIIILLILFSFLIGISISIYLYPDYDLFNQYISNAGEINPETDTPRYIFQITFFIQSILLLWLGYLVIVIKTGDNLFLGILCITMSIGYICTAFPCNIGYHVHTVGATIIYIGIILFLGLIVYYTKNTNSVYFYLFIAVFIIGVITMTCIVIDELVFNQTFSIAKFFQKMYFVIGYMTVTIFFFNGLFDKLIISENIPSQYREKYLRDTEFGENEDICNEYRDLIHELTELEREKN